MAWAPSNGGSKVRRRRTGDEEYKWQDSLHDHTMMVFDQFFAGTEGRSDDPPWPETPPMPSGTRAKRLGPEQQLSAHPPTHHSSLGREEDGPRRLDMPPMPSRTQARYLGPEQQMSPRPPARNSSLGWEEERPLPPHRGSSSRWQEEEPLSGLGTLSSRPQPYQPAQREARDANQGQRHGAKVRLQTPVGRRQRTPQEDEDESGSSRSNSLSGSTVIVEPDDSNSQGSDRFEEIKHDVYESTSGSADEDGYVHVPGRGRRPHRLSFRPAPR